MNGLRILAKVRGEALDELRLTTARPMFHPVPLAHLAGRGFTPQRRTPLDGEHEAAGAVWMPAGVWRRPEYYALADHDRSAAIRTEVQAVRSGVGIIDVGKVEAHGPHAAEFLERIYAGRLANLKVGVTRYGLMLDESGVVIDDGVIGRLGPESFYFTTTTGNSAVLFREFGRLAALWGLPVGLVNLTGHCAAVNVAGPKSRRVLGRLTTLDLDLEAFPYLGIRETEVAGIACRILRVGFVGELGYEIHLPADRAQDLWRTLLAAGANEGIRPFGVEAQRMLRLEKGHIIIGQDTDGVTNALELGMPWAIRMDKPFFIGQRSLQILGKLPRHQTLVGFSLPAESDRPKECHLVLAGDRIAGRVTSVGLSPTLGKTIGLALVEPAVAASGSLQIRIDGNQLLNATVEAPPFYDPGAARQRPTEEPAVSEHDPAATMAAARRSPLDAWYRGAGHGRARVEDMEMPGALRAPQPESATLYFTDLSWRRRLGCKGPGAPGWLAGQGFTVPAPANSVAVDAQDILVARLATSEFMVEAGLDAGATVSAARRVLESAQRPATVYPVVRQDFALELSGAGVNGLLRQTCPVDFAPLLEPGSDGRVVVFTSIVGVGVLAWPRGSARDVPRVTIWCDPSFAEYFWTTLLEVAADLPGGVAIAVPGRGTP
jgi:sarcosine oxidase, subunit alpha